MDRYGKISISFVTYQPVLFDFFFIFLTPTVHASAGDGVYLYNLC